MNNRLFWFGFFIASIGLSIMTITLLTPKDVTEVDWSDLGVVTAVKDQSQVCVNVSWAFASVASIEGLMGIKSIVKLTQQSHPQLLSKSRREYLNKLREFSTSYSQENLSEQQILDCTPKSDNCEGGDVADAYSFAQEYGIVDYQLIPYIAKKEICPMDKKSASVFNITGYQMQSGCDTLKSVIFQQPVAVRINYSNLTNYLTYDMDKDVISTNICSQSQLDQTKSYQYVLVTAYDGNTFTIKNSEGVNWGFSGYAKIDATIDNVCNICDVLYYPVQNN